MKRKIHAIITGIHPTDAFITDKHLIGKTMTFDRLASNKGYSTPDEHVMRPSPTTGFFAGTCKVGSNPIQYSFLAIQFDIIKPPKRKRIKNEPEK